MWLALITLDIMALCAQKVLDWCDEWRDVLEPNYLTAKNDPELARVWDTDSIYDEPPTGTSGTVGGVTIAISPNGSDTVVEHN
jgi:hypothetical protein